MPMNPTAETFLRQSALGSADNASFQRLIDTAHGCGQEYNNIARDLTQIARSTVRRGGVWTGGLG